MHPKNISILDYTYSLPDEKIAAFPLAQRDASKLLIYKDGIIQQDIYKNIAQYLPEKSLLVFNNTKVIPARILFQKASGSTIEIFCLEPYDTVSEYNVAMQQQGTCKWKCMVGGLSKWKEKTITKRLLTRGDELVLTAEVVEKLSDAYVIKFSWQPASLSFAEIIQYAGETPLPPYIKRKADNADKERYQTIYATYDGSVAAPTAGLHFTEEIFALLAKKEIAKAYVTLHVGAGTFKPVKASQMHEHEMHTEWIEVGIDAIEQLLANHSNTIVATGTTSLRTIESLYWMGIKTILDPYLANEALALLQWEVYETALAETNYTVEESLTALLNWMKKDKQEKLITKTQILITPGYRFRVAKALITNFHQPQSTLLLLVAAAIKNDPMSIGWRNIYQYALENDFRFLSYGDGSLLFIAQQ